MDFISRVEILGSNRRLMACRYFSTPFVSLLGSLNLEGKVMPGLGEEIVNHGSIENELHGMTVSFGSLISSRSAHTVHAGVHPF
jgi:hypothetical protein